VSPRPIPGNGNEPQRGSAHSPIADFAKVINGFQQEQKRWRDWSLECLDSFWTAIAYCPLVSAVAPITRTEWIYFPAIALAAIYYYLRLMRPPRPLPPPILLLLLLVVSVLLTYLVPTPAISVPFHRPVALLFVLAGVACSASGFFTFKQIGTPVKPGAEPTQLVLKGPYRFTRNPMYLGLLLFSIGMFFAAQSLWFLIPPILFFLIINFWLIPFEENFLRERFAKGYDDYCRQVRRWL
jgi:protein-S-isoprenylcysteine O-methyltransferase Ste14